MSIETERIHLTTRFEENNNLVNECDSFRVRDEILLILACKQRTYQWCF